MEYTEPPQPHSHHFLFSISVLLITDFGVSRSQDMYSEHSAAIAAPPHRRRRPPLACLQCRRRKIKCDQNKPCNQCQRSKNVTCTYGSDISPSQHDNRQLAGARHKLESTFQLPPRESSTVHSSPSTSAAQFTEQDISRSHAIISKDPTLETLVIDDLHRQAAPVPSFVPGAIPDSSLSPRQYPSKPSLFGENHWMYHFTQVRSSHTYMNFLNTKRFKVQRNCKLLVRQRTDWCFRPSLGTVPSLSTVQNLRTNNQVSTPS